MLLLIFLCLIAELTSVSGDCVVGLQNVKLNWNKVGIGVMTRFLKQGSFKLLLGFCISFVVSLTNSQQNISHCTCE